MKSVRFVFHGTVTQLNDTIRLRARQLHRDILLEQDDADTLRIGFQRLSHRGGRFFVAKVTEEDGSVVLSGEFKDIYSQYTQGKFRAVLAELGTWIGVYLQLALVPFAVWLAFGDVRWLWLPLLLPLAVMLLGIFLNRNQDANADERFLRFMEAVTAEKITVPACSADLLKMLLEAEDLHSVPQLKDDVLRWELYDGVRVDVGLNEVDCVVEILRDRGLELELMHWHTDPEEIYEELLNLGKKGNILVLRKPLFGIETFYMGPAADYPYDPGKKWHWGRLTYLKQRV